MSMVIEWAPFKLAPEASEDELLRASDALQAEFLEKQPGYVARELLRNGADAWCDLVYWASADAAEQAMQEAMNSPICHGYFRLMQGVNHENPGADVQHLAVIKSYAQRK